MVNKMRLIWLILTCVGLSVFAVEVPAKTLIVENGDQSSYASVKPARMKGQPGVAVVFEGTDELHYYAVPEAGGTELIQLKVSAKAEGLKFGGAIYPEFHDYNDPAIGKVGVYAGNFTIFVPLTSPVADAAETKDVTVTIEGQACTSKMCLAPFTKEAAAKIDLSQSGNWAAVDFKPAPGQETPDVQPKPETPTTTEPETQPAEADTGLADTLSSWKGAGANGSVWWYFLMAILAGLSINILPCVLPVIPLIIMRLVSHAKESGPKRTALGLSFCGGIILFFAVFAAISAVIKISTGESLDMNTLYRNPPAVVAFFLFIVFFALVLMDIMVISLPSSIAGKQGGGSGFVGSVGTGFFAGVLSTPCSGAVIGIVLVWAQTQPWYISSTLMILMGVGMALPYAFLVSMPKLLDYVPKPGTWMELFKKTGGFLLLLLAVKFTLTALPKNYLISVLLYGVIFAFSMWMWGTWVTFSTPRGRKWIIRGIAVLIAVGFGCWLLPAPQTSPVEPQNETATQVQWQKYEPETVQKALQKGQPVLIKFTADWCTNCKIVEKRVYQDPDTAAFLKQKGFVTILADTTQESYQATVDYNTIFKGAGSVPNTVLLNPDKKTITNLRGIFTSEELKDVINKQF